MKIFVLFEVSVIGSLALLLLSDASAAALTHQPLISSVTSSTAKVWVRTDSAARVWVEYSSDPELAAPALTADVDTSGDSDFTATLDMDGLAPLTAYYYRVVVDGVDAQTADYPSFVTFPSEGMPSDFSVGVVSDLINTRSRPEIPAPAYQALAEESPAFVLQIGDFDHGNPGTLAEMRNMRKRTRGPNSAAGTDWASEIAPYFPVYYVWDDHDYGANNADKTFSGRADALRVYDEYFPIERPNPTAGVWHSIIYGDVEIFMLDVRSQRDPAGVPDGPNKSLLNGDDIYNGQKDWLFNRLAASTARWKVLVSGVPFKSDAKPDDAWGAYSTERQELLDWIASNHIDNVFVVSGDLHTGGAIDDGTHADLPEISVPHTNLETQSDSTGPQGLWSHGTTPGSDGGGYAMLKFSAVTGEVLLEAKDETGAVRHSLTLQSVGEQRSEQTFRPTQDVFVRENRSTHEAWARLRTDTAPNARARSFLRFDVSTVSGDVKSAVLRLYVHSDSGAFEVVELTNINFWKDMPGGVWTWADKYPWCGSSRLTSGNCRTTGSQAAKWICGSGQDCSNSFVEVDVTDLVRSGIAVDNWLLFGLQQRSGAVVMSSANDRLVPARSPILTIVTDSAAATP
jgi:alkaline phosphatase D